jgi:hypothetical protein
LWFRSLVECAANIALRHEELLGLRVKQFDLEHRIPRLEPGTTKNGEGREAPMFGNMYQLLAACCQGKRPDDAVFTWTKGKPVLGIRDTWARACCAAGEGAMYCMQCDQPLANQKLPECPGCGRKLTRNQQKLSWPDVSRSTSHRCQADPQRRALGANDYENRRLLYL